MLPKLLTSIFGSRNDRLLKQYRQVVVQINALEPQFEALDDTALRAKTDEFRCTQAGLHCQQQQGPVAATAPFPSGPVF